MRAGCFHHRSRKAGATKCRNRQDGPAGHDRGMRGRMSGTAGGGGCGGGGPGEMRPGVSGAERFGGSRGGGGERGPPIAGGPAGGEVWRPRAVGEEGGTR